MNINRYRSIISLLFVVALFICACNQEAKKPARKKAKKHWDNTIPGSFSQQVDLKLDSNQVDSFFTHYPDLKAYGDQVKSFYRNRQFAYAWYENGQVIEQANNLANRVMNLENDGVYKQIPYKKTLDSLLNGAGAKSKSTKPDLTLDLMLTSQYFAFAKMVYDGEDASVSKANGWNVPRKKVNYNQYLDSLLKKPAKQQADEPVYRQYDLLKSFLKKYRALDTAEKWLPITTKKLKTGDSSLAVKQVKRRLYLLEDYKGDTLSSKYDTSLKAAVKIFQRRNGLAASGAVDAGTLAAMNVPLKTRIMQILVNMERSRWLPVTISGDYLAVNIPEFQLHVYHADSLLWNCNVVVGQTTHPTTIFSGDIKYVVFSPYWNVPPSIVRNEVLPGIKRNSNYLSAHRMEITSKEDGLPVVRQKPGEANSLGLVKFLFPNSYNIYLHDTPSKSLFGETSRAFSHGCIRVLEPAKLANFLLADSAKWSPATIKKAMHAGKEQYITLKKKVPVFIAYFTAFTDRDNRLNFRKDIYNLDDRLAATLISGQIAAK
ncbi:L,D-transpeptidase family protein [Mucilaginibacter glaciei]|uniref:L,D-transpeptidase family protein n=1 Tax=Mucilaginibacter glaciei TaxID=2772109 RepID=A0A926NH15_9SPHI|nr:L,D-transpeptidase family protein [Mucilaginibacter glaciei]MBD1391934.1 L,D-transpeptidase family protein [Mucilaginibacter glaciei]